MSNENESLQELSLLGIPQDLRIRFFEKYILNPVENKSLRLVCSDFKYEIDYLIGINSVVSFNFDSVFYNPERVEFLRSVALQEIRLDNLLEMKVKSLDSIITTPSKLFSCQIQGAISPQLLQEMLKKCFNLKSLNIKATIIPEFLYQEARIMQRMFTFHSLKRLTIILLIGVNSVCKGPIQNALMLLKSIHSPRLQDFDFQLDYGKSMCIDLLEVLYALTEFIGIHPNLKILRVSFKGRELIEESVIDIPQYTQSKQDEIMRKIENVQAKINKFKKSDKLWKFEEFILDLDLNFKKDRMKDNLTIPDFWMDLLLSLEEEGNLRNIGIKMKTPCSLPQILQLIDLNYKTLTKFFLECPLYFSINFLCFQSCTNLQSISLHDGKWKYQNLPVEFIRNCPTQLQNVSMGLEYLPNLNSLVVNGLIMRCLDVEALATRPMKILGLREIARKEYFGDDVIVNPPGLPPYNGISYRAFMGMMNNPSLEALFLDMDSVSINRFEEGFKVEIARERLSGEYRSFFLDISDSNDKNFPYWKPSFLGFSVDFPIY